MDVIAEYRLQVKYLDGKMHPVSLRIGRPTQRPTGVWECETEIEGAPWLPVTKWPDIFPTPASTSWQALLFNIQFIYKMIRIEVNRGAQLYFDGGMYPIHLHELFPFHQSDTTTQPE